MTFACDECRKLTSGRCPMHAVETIIVGPAVMLSCPGCGYAGSGTHTCGGTVDLNRISLEAEVARLHGELARERAMRASTGCECPTAPIGAPLGGIATLDVARLRLDGHADDMLPFKSPGPAGHAAGCPAMEGGRLREELAHCRVALGACYEKRDHWKAVALAMREAARGAAGRFAPGHDYADGARIVLAAVESAFREPGDAPKGGTDG